VTKPRLAASARVIAVLSEKAYETEFTAEV
jgi:hypothetical protein